MVSRYGVSREGAVGVTVGALGAMHCVLPCSGPHHHHHLAASHSQNPQAGHNHHVHPAHQPPPPPSPSPHINQLAHPQLTVNISHLQHHQQQQQTHQQIPQQFRVTANRSEFHGNYNTQPGPSQVGGGAAGNVGVPTGRGPPPLGSIQTIGQSAAGIPPGGPAGGQAPSQAPTPGVQSQPPQGPAPTTTPPVHTPSPQEMGKQGHLQTQPPSLQQVYVPTQSRPASQLYISPVQGYYPTGPRPQQPRGISHRGGQGTSGTPVVGMAGVGGGGGQPPAIYQHPTGLPVQTSAMYISQSQVHGLHTGPHQQYVNPMNNQIPIHQFSGPPQRHQPHQSQSFYQTYQHPPILTPPNVFGYAHAPAPQHGYYYTASNTMSLSRASTSAVSGGAQHVAGPLAGAQGAPVVPQATLQQPAQQAQPLPPMGIPLSQTDVYSGHNGGATNANTTRSRKPRGQNAILDIVNPLTGKNISDEIYKDNETTQSGESSNRETPQPQNNGAEVIADFAARVAKAATEESDSVSTNASETAPNTTQSTAQTSLSNVQSNSSNDANSQCNTGPPTPTQKNIAGAGASNIVSAISSQSLGTCSNAAQIDSSSTKTESKALQLPVKEFQPRSEIKNMTIEESSPVIPPMVAVVNKDPVSVQLTASSTTNETVPATAKVAAEPEPEPEVAGAGTVGTVAGTGTGSVVSEATKNMVIGGLPNALPTRTTAYWCTITQEHLKPSATAPNANPVLTKEPFPNLSAKTSSNSPPRRKPNTTELPSNTKDAKERKTREKSLGSRGATPTPVPNQVTAEHHHQKTNGDAAGDKAETEVLPRNEIQQKPADGKAMQKQKSKNKLKPRELNRKGAEKEGTDMDAFVNTAPTTKTADAKQDGKEQQRAPTPKDNIKDSGRDISIDTKSKDNYETKKEEILPVHVKTEKHASPEIAKESTPVQVPQPVDKLPTKEALKESSPKIEENAKPNACNTQSKPVPNDVVDHAIVKEEEISVEAEAEALVAQKNEENFKVSALHTSNDEKATTVTPTVTEKKPEVETPPSSNSSASTEATASKVQLKYTYKEDQWSPINTTGKKIYDRDFLMKLQSDPNSKIKPPNLPNLQGVIKDTLQNAHNANMDLRTFKDANITRHDSLMPGFAKSNMNSRPPPTSRKSDRGKPKANKPNVIHVSLSLREDVKLRETENAWKPTRMKQIELSEEEAGTEILYKTVRSVLNKLTPQKFRTLVNQVKELPIDTQERLQGVINLVFEKAVDEPSFSVEYALMCKELALMEVAKPDNQDSTINFKKLIITRCQKEFEKNPIDEVARSRKLKEIDECTDTDKKKELQLILEEEERRVRVKSVGNIRFIGELYKQQILTTKIMHRCIRHLLDQNDEDNLECLCKLLTTIGKDLECKGSCEEMQEYFNKMQEIVSRKSHSKISSRIRFMLQDVIELRANKWVPRRNENNPKTIDEIQKEAESERLDMQVNSASLNTPRKDDRNSDRKRNRGVGGPTDDGWSQPVGGGRVRPTTYSVETAKLKNKPPPMDDMQLGNRASYLWRTTNPSSNSKTISANKFACLENMSNLDQDKRVQPLPLSGSRSTGPRECGRDYKSSYDGRGSRNGTHQMGGASTSRDSHSLLDNPQGRNLSMPPPVMKSASQSGAISHKPLMSEQEFTKAYNSILKHYLEEPIVENTGLEIQQKFDNATFAKFTRECINFVLEKSPIEREQISKLLSHLLRRNIIPVQYFKSGLTEVLEIADDLVIDIPKIWTYLAEILSHSIEDGAISFSEMKSVFLSLRSMGYVGKFIGELLTKVSRSKGQEWVATKWKQSGLQWNDLIDPEHEQIDKITKEYNLEFLTGDYNSAKGFATTDELSLEKIKDHLIRLMKENTSFDEICSWITTNVGDRDKDPRFIRHLMTAILETTFEKVHNTWKLNLDTLTNLETLIQRFVDANELLELQCLYAIQNYMTAIEFPPGTLIPIMNQLWMDNVISSDAFLTWKSKVPEAKEDLVGHSISLVALTSFFTDLQEPDDNSSVEELSTSAKQEDC